MSASADKAATLLELHAAPALLKVVNVWDVISAKVIADLHGTRALATASHSIAASFGCEDGEKIPVDLMIEAVGRIAAASDLPVSADLEAGYGDPGEAVRKAIGVGIVGANIEDQMKPLPDAVAAVDAVVRAGEGEGVPFVLNARTDVFIRANRDGAPKDVLADAIERGKAYLDVGAPVVFFPGRLTSRRSVRSWRYSGRGRARSSRSPAPFRSPNSTSWASRVFRTDWSQRVALTALADSTADVIAGGALPEGTRPLN
jgi:2-methylisocitrate lyase-like PEP mutase family enzyme